MEARRTLRARDRRRLFAAFRALGILPAVELLEQVVRRHHHAPFRHPARQRAGPRSRVRALPPQPRRLRADVLPAFRERRGGAAHRGRREPESAGAGPVPAQGRRVLPAPQLQVQRAVLGGVLRIRQPAGAARRAAGIFHRRHPLPHRTVAGAARGNAGDDGARVPARAAPAGVVPAGLHRLRKTDGRPFLHRRAVRPEEGKGILAGPAARPACAAPALRTRHAELRRAGAAEPAARRGRTRVARTGRRRSQA